MHFHAAEIVAQFIHSYLPMRRELRIADIGAQNVNGCLRAFFSRQKWTYIGVDIAPGKNVDVVCEEGKQLPFDAGTIDVIVSVSMLEHCLNPVQTCTDMGQALRVGGWICLVAPYACVRTRIHRHPVDCWRFMPDGMEVLCRAAGCVPLDCAVSAKDCYVFGQRQET